MEAVGSNKINVANYFLSCQQSTHGSPHITLFERCRRIHFVPKKFVFVKTLLIIWKLKSLFYHKGCRNAIDINIIC